MTDATETSQTITAVIAVSGRNDAPEALYQTYREGLARQSRPVEFIYVLDGPLPEVRAALRRLQQEGEPVRIIQLNRTFGEAAALSAAFRYARGDIIVTLPAFHQVVVDDLPRLIDGLANADMVVARRSPRTDSGFNRLQTRAFAGLARFLTRTQFHDLGCNVRALRRRVVDEVMLYGDQHRFLPILALNYGFRVLEIALPQSSSERFRRIYPLGTVFRRLIDLLTVFFITKFTRRPMRFYGLIGSATAGFGGLYMAYLVFQRLFMDVALADRPALLLAALLVVIGAQIFSMGLIGELIIYVNARQMDEYAIEAVIEQGEPLAEVPRQDLPGQEQPQAAPARSTTGAGV